MGRGGVVDGGEDGGASGLEGAVDREVVVGEGRLEKIPVSKTSMQATRVKDTLIDGLATDLNCAKGAELSVLGSATFGTISLYWVLELMSGCTLMSKGGRGLHRLFQWNQ